jgi:hypothetical protein
MPPLEGQGVSTNSTLGRSLPTWSSISTVRMGALAPRLRADTPESSQPSQFYPSSISGLIALT